MEVLQTMTSQKNITDMANVKTEVLPSGESITKAIKMGSKACCGAGWIEKAQ